MAATLKTLPGLLDGDGASSSASGGRVAQRAPAPAGHGITRGAEVQVVRRAPMGDPIEVVVKNYHLACGRKWRR
jgi:hypothetical protein